MSGKIEVIIGPMFSSKSSTLLARIRRHEIAGRSCIVIKYIKDTRYDEKHLTTHDLIKHPALPADDLSELDNVVAEYDCIGIDEGQFFKNLAASCDKWANNGKIVIVSGLDSTFARKPFGEMPALMAIAEKIDKLSAVCQTCGQDAAYSKRKVESEEVELIGGADKYVASCRKCYFTS